MTPTGHSIFIILEFYMRMRNEFNSPAYLLVSDREGNFFEVPDLLMTGMLLGRPYVIESTELIKLPEGSDLFRLPGRMPIGFDPKKDKFVEVDSYCGIEVEAVAAFMAPAYLQMYHASYSERNGAPRLPLYAYTAAGWRKGAVYAAGMRIDKDKRQDRRFFDCCSIEREAMKKVKQFPNNRLVEHLVNNCVLRYGCPAASNFVLNRWECPVPTSMACNANCLGCISKQPCESGFKASHHRISFTPTVDEIVEYVTFHLENAPAAVASFGQGCEGEPLLEGELLEEAIRQIRKRTSRGVINLNTNGSRPATVEKLCRVGLDSIRVSLNSAREEYYNAYFRPHGYKFTDVIESLRIARECKRWTSINYLIFPGFIDANEEFDALCKLITTTGLNMIQTRNLNIDPLFYIDRLGLTGTHHHPFGIGNWVKKIKNAFPKITLGYFNPPEKVVKGLKNAS